MGGGGGGGGGATLLPILVNKNCDTDSEFYSLDSSPPP